MLITITRLGFLFLLVLCFLITLVESASVLEKETSSPEFSGDDDRSDRLSSSASRSSLSPELTISPLSSAAAAPTETSPKASSTSSAESNPTLVASLVKPLELSTFSSINTSAEPPKESSVIKSQSMDEEIESEEIRATSLPPITSKKSSSSHTSSPLHSSSTSSSSHLALSASALPTQDPQLDDDDLEDDTELIRTESIQEARLARKKQRATPRPTPPHHEEKKAEVENALAAANPHQNTNIKEQPVIQGPNDQGSIDNTNSDREMHSGGGEGDSQASAAERNNQDQDAPGLGKVGTALLSVGGVLMVAGITGGIFVWRAQQHQQQHQGGLPQHHSPTASMLMSSSGHHHQPPTALNLLDDSINGAAKYQTPPSTPLSKAPQSQTMLDLNYQGPASASTDFASFERHDLMNNWQNGLDFNYSMEKLFNNHTRPPHHPSARNSRASPAQVRGDDKSQIDSPSVNTSYRPFSASSSSQLHNTTYPMPTGESLSNLHDVNDPNHHSYEDYAQGLHAASPISIYFPSSSPPPQSPPLLQQECKVNINLVHKDT